MTSEHDPGREDWRPWDRPDPSATSEVTQAVAPGMPEPPG